MPRSHDAWRWIDTELLAAMILDITGTLEDQLECDHDQLVCPLQNITCLCVVTGSPQVIFWRLNSKLIAYFDHQGQCGLTNNNCSATVEVLQSPQGLSSNVSFVAELQPGPTTIECRDTDANSYTLSFSTIGMFIKITLHIFTKHQVILDITLWHRATRSTSHLHGHGSEQLLC